MSETKTALVLEGGAMRGMYTAGVLDCFMDHGICFDAVIGVSAGALFIISENKNKSVPDSELTDEEKDIISEDTWNKIVLK